MKKVKSIVVGIGINTNQEEMYRGYKKYSNINKKEFGVDVDNRRFIS
ncbi:MAG: hypothetical protein V8R82_11480 [Clostridia bacterium]